jgi:PAS domain S-box-containing protein
MMETSEPLDDVLVRLFDLSLDAFCIAGLDGYLKLANPAFARILGYTQEELLARPFMDYVHPDDRESVRAVLGELARGNDIVGFQCRQVRADGSVRWLEWNTRTRPEEGVVYGVARDITDRRVAGAELNALRRVATLVAEGVQPQDLFAVVAEEVARVVDVPLVSVARYELDGTATECASHSPEGPVFPVGNRWSLEGTNVLRLVRASSAAARIDDYSGLEGEIVEAVRRIGIRSTVGIPIVVAGRLWGAMVVSSTEQLPEGTEARLADFTELLATAIANAESREALEQLVSELAASRRRIVAASDQARRRIERDLHDGTQQRLAALGLAVRAAEANVPPDRGDLRAELSGIATELADSVAELRELSRGIHPAILSQGGLGPALRTLARRSTIPVDLDVTTDARFPEPIEVAAYYVASEALANATRHAQASRIEISLAPRDGRALLSIRDDGVGGADPARGSGLVGLTDRVEALGGSIRVRSRPGNGTHITAELPLELDVGRNPEEPSS